jgi:hypothetical protein
MRTNAPHTRRSGNILVMTLMMMVSVVALLAFAVDLGYVYLVNTEIQRSADAAALSSAWELLEGQVKPSITPQVAVAEATSSASLYTRLNKAGGISPALGASDVKIGQLVDTREPNSSWVFSDPSRYNAVHVRVRRTDDQNREVPFFFARALGFDSVPLQAGATAVFLNNFRGFQVPSDGKNLDLLPFALDKDTWDDLMQGVGSDDWTWDAEHQQVVAGPDGILEVNLYPQGTGSPGNRGTVDIGDSNNSTCDISRQINEGVSPADLAHHGGKLEFDDNGQLPLNGDTGISAGVKDDLQAIRGKPRIIPIFSEVVGPGNNATYTIVKFAGIRIMEVKLTGKNSSKRVIIQPASVIIRGGIPSTQETTSSYVYSPVWLVR